MVPRSNNRKNLRIEKEIRLVQMNPSHLILSGCDQSNIIRYSSIIELSSNSTVLALKPGEGPPGVSVVPLYFENLVEALNLMESFSNLYLFVQDQTQLIVEQKIGDEKISVKMSTIFSPTEAMFGKVKFEEDFLKGKWTDRRLTSVGLVDVLDSGGLDSILRRNGDNFLNSRDLQVDGGRPRFLTLQTTF